MTNKEIAVASLALSLLSLSTVASAGVCEYADTTYTKVATGITGAGVATGVGLNVAGVTAVVHGAAGGTILTASTGYLAGTLGAIGSAAAFITAPATIIVGAVAVTAAGGTILYCNYSKDEKNTSPAHAGAVPNKAKRAK